jgi:DNA polymerase-3 subunit epsilon
MMSDNKILWLDIETTGKAKAYDQVVQVAYGWENEDGELVEEESILVRPSVPISRGAFETHGISDDMVANSPTFAQAASELADRIKKAEMIATYNGNRFDIPILDAEFKRAGMSVELSSKLPLDALRLLQVMNPRDLSTMHEKYVGETLEGAHDALADIRGTHALYRSMKSAFDLDATPDHQIAHSLKGLNITVDGKLTWDEWDPDVIILNYGKYSGRPMEWVIENDPGYLRWMINADKERFDSITVELVEIAQMALNGTNAFYQWVQSTYGDPPTEIHELHQTVGHQSRRSSTSSGSCPQCGGPTHQYPIFGGDPNDPDLIDVDVVCQDNGCDVRGYIYYEEGLE